MAKKTLAEKFGESDQPPDFDIENENPFAHVDEQDSASDESDEELKKEHYVPVGKSKLRSQNGSLVKGEKYKGAISSRKDIYNDSDSGSDNDEEDSGSDDISEDDMNEEEDEEKEDLEDAENESDSGASLRANSEDESSENESESESESESDEEDADVKREKIKAMMSKERKHIVNRLSEAATQEALKGYAILQQHKLFDSLIDARIKVQKGLTNSNLLPANHETLKHEDLEDEDSEELLEKASQKCYSLLDSILQLRSRLYVKENVVNEPVEHKPKKRSLESYLDATSKYDNILNDYRSNVLTKWSAKIQNSSGFSAMNASKFKALNQSAEQQVMNNLADMERLVKRTKLNRRQLKPLGHEYYEASLKKDSSDAEKPEDDSEVPETQSRSLNVQEMDSIFDDEDFYRVLLNDLVDKKISSTDPTSGLQFAMRGAASAKVKKNVDNKASKGRKLRYHVQEPIANFETPQNVLKWEDDQIDEFFASLLGQKVSMKEDVSDEEEVEDEPLVGDNTIKLFG